MQLKFPRRRRILSVLLALLMTAALALPAAAAQQYNQSVYYMIPVRKGSYYGYLCYRKSLGTVVERIGLSQDYSDVKPFGSNGLAPVKRTLSAAYGYMDINGKWKLSPKYLQARTFADNGLAAAQDAKTEKWGYINSSGKWVISPKYDQAYSFSSGFALVLDNWEFYFIDASGNRKIHLDKTLNYDLQSFSYGLFVVRSSDGAGFMDTSGKWIVNPDKSPFRRIGTFHSNGSQKVALAEDRDGAWGYIDANGKWVIQPSRDLEDAGMFGINGLAPAKRGSKYGYIDRQYDSRPTSSRFRIAPKFQQANAFENCGLAAVQDQNGKWGIIRSNGSCLVQPAYDAIGSIGTVIIKN